MNEHVLAAAVRRDEAVALLVVEPLYSSARHVQISVDARLARLGRRKGGRTIGSQIPSSDVFAARGKGSTKKPLPDLHGTKKAPAPASSAVAAAARSLATN